MYLRLTSFAGFLFVFAPMIASAAAYPRPTLDIGPDHPLFLFDTSGLAAVDVQEYAGRIAQCWDTLPDQLRPYSALVVTLPGGDLVLRHERCRQLAAALQEADIPIVVQIAGGGAGRLYPVNQIEALVSEFACIKGVQAGGLLFDDYPPFAIDSLGVPAEARWLSDAIRAVAQYGRLVVINLGGLTWPRLMSNAGCRPLYETFRECAPHIVPLSDLREAHHYIASETALMGLWLEGGAGQWGVAASSSWYTDARFKAPGVFGYNPDPASMPPFFYRAMVLNGAMAGACVYAFQSGDDLWFGQNRRFWDESIYPVLVELIERGFVAPADFVRKKAAVAYKLTPSRTPLEFFVNLRDIDALYGEGLLIRGAYGVEDPVQIPELVLNSGRHYWIPIVSSFAASEALAGFEMVAGPGTAATAEEWTALLDRRYRPDGAGTAFICRAARGVYIMNTRENSMEQQSFRVPNVPKPVRGFEASRSDRNVTLTWPFREGDVTYRIYRRVLPEQDFTLVAPDVDQRRWVDEQVDPEAAIAYAVTALTNEEEPYEGTVGYGECLALSVVESRVEEEAVVTPLLSYGRSRSVESDAGSRNLYESPSPAEGLDDTQVPVATAILDRIETWERAFSNEDLEAVLELYATDYEDAQGWGYPYARRAYKWFFQRYQATGMARQVRKWDFGAYPADGTVRVLLYCRFEGIAVSDPGGRFAGKPAHFPRQDPGEIWLTFTQAEGPWRILHTEPALPNFNDILGFSTGPYDGWTPGPDD